MRLLVIRHAIAMEREEFRKISTDDGERPLTADGIKKMRKNAAGLKQIVTKIDFIFTSPLVRAEQTAALVASEYADMPVERCDAMTPESKPSELLTFLKSRFKGQLPEMRDAVVAVVGHEPHLSHLLNYLISGKSAPLVELRKGGACLFNFENGLIAGKADLEWLVKPSILRTLAKL